MNRFLIKYILLVVIVIINLNAFGQSPHFKKQDLFKGHSGYTVNDVFQDSKGLIWYGTSDGLVLYNGVSYQKFTTNDSLSSNYVSIITEDQDHNLWIGHKKGKISIVNTTLKITKYNKLDSLLSEEISTIKFLAKNHFFIGTLGNGIVEVKENQIKTYNSDNKVADDFIYDIEIDKNGLIWFASDIGAISFNINKNSWNKISMDDGLPDNIIKDLEFDDLGNLWLGMEEQGLAIYNVKTKQIKPVPLWEFGYLNHFIIRENNEIWISTTDNGVIKLNFENYSQFRYKKYAESDGLISNKTYNIFEDNEGNIWIASRGGLSQFTGNLFEFLNTNGGLPSDQVYSFYIDSKNRYWVGCSNGLYIMTELLTGEFSSQHLLEGEKYKNHMFTSIYEDNNKNIWVSTYGYGVYKFNEESLEFKNYTSEQGLSNGNVISISGDDNKLWFSTSGGGVNYLDINEPTVNFKSFTKDDGLGSNYTYAAYKDSKKRVWIAKDGGGISLLENEKLKNIDGFDTLTNVVYGIAEDGSNNIWFTTAYDGIIKYDGQKFRQFTTKDELISNSFNSIIIDNYDNCILASNEGISVIDTKTNESINYGEDEGVAFLQPNLNAIHKDLKGNIWISTNNGIIKYNPDIKHKKQPPIKIYITKKQTFYDEITDSTATLKHDQNHLVFNYIGLWYKSPEKLSYRYKLEGQDVDWTYAHKSLTATYSGLPPGKYTFVVQVTKEETKWNDSQSAKFYFEIELPFWQKWWFITSVIIIIVLGIYFFFKLRLASLKKSEEKLKSEVKRRTSEISKQKEEIELQKDTIEERNKEITDSIQYAKRIQNAILPPQKLVKEYMVDSFILYKPKDIVAGDFYWLEHKEDKILFAAADCTGHGVPGAMVSVVCNNGLNRCVREYGLTDPGEILDKTRELVVQEFGKSEDDVKDGMDIALCSLEGHTLKYAGAHNPLWLIRNGELIETKANKQPIGQFDNPEPYTTHTLKLQKGDTIYIFSDGYADQFGGEKGKKLKTANFKKLLLSMQKESMEKQKQLIDVAFENWKGNLEQLDDVCVIGLRI